jgi:Xaa-Pro aminopeptidase
VDATKFERLQRFCAEPGGNAGLGAAHSYAGVWLRRRANIAWITDGADVHCDLSSELGVASVLWTPTALTVLTDDIELPRLAAEEFSDEWEVRSTKWWDPPATAPARFATDWPEDNIAPLRYALTPLEVERVRALGREAASVLESVMLEVRRGDSENEVAGAIIAGLRAQGIVATVVLVAADERIAFFRHPIPTSKRIEQRLMAAICAERHGLIVSATRLVHFGTIDAELRRRHDAVCRVDATLHARTEVGASYGDIFRAAQALYAETGFQDEWTKHHQGGPMGYAARDFKASPHETRRVAPNQLVGWNPSITGTKSEDTLLAGGEVVTHTGAWPMNGTRPDILVRR